MTYKNIYLQSQLIYDIMRERKVKGEGAGNMTGEEYKALSIDERVIYINERLAERKSLTKIFEEELDISKSQTNTIKKNGYILQENKEGIKQYVKEELKGQQSILLAENTPQESHTEPKNEVMSINTPIADAEPLQSENKAIAESYINRLLQEQKEKVKKVSAGRPEKAGRRKATIYMEDISFKELQQWALWNNCSASDVLNALLKDFLKDVLK